MSVDHSQLTRDSSTWDLLIKNVKPHHAGVYECQVTANHLIAQYVTLNVIGKQGRLHLYVHSECTRNTIPFGKQHASLFP